ncbi:immunoglobulin superfamily member 1-like [Engraulis encrasicolus]|uniref:immunoglobulin superfamily member 1-like n=1 Tax=Engraulis encrasicolus TaxID=184585 RepID=UPI002FD2B406
MSCFQRTAAQIRLVSGSTACSGRVEVYHSGQWGTVCNDNWGMNDAEVLCRQLGCGEAESAPMETYCGSGKIWMDGVHCSGPESSLEECLHNGFGTHRCNHGDDAGVVCSGNVPVRVVGGTNNCSGRVEAYHNGQWGTVCGDSWDINNGKVVCRQLGCGNAVSASHEGHFDNGSGVIWLNHIHCLGDERFLAECPRVDDGNCSHEDASVVCSGPAPVRLVGESQDCSGRVEVYHNGTWGTVCDDDWDMDDTKVVCRQLGCGCAVSALGGAHFGSGTGVIWMDDVHCSGSELFLVECSHNGFGTHNCNHAEDVSVVCSGPEQPPKISLTMPHSAVLPGDTIEFGCAKSSDICPTTVCHLYKDGNSIMTRSTASNQKHVTFTFPNVDLSNQGNYSCAYSPSFSMSASIDLTVVALPKPNLKIGRSAAWGQSVQMSCSISTQYLGGTFTLQQLSGSYRETKAASGSSADFTIRQVDFVHEGSYYCQYQTQVSNRDFTSSHSDSVSFLVAVPLEKPLLTLELRNSPSWGQSQLSGSLTKTERSTGNSSTFIIPQVDFVHEGSYYCQYQTQLSGRNFTSTHSDSGSYYCQYQTQVSGQDFTSSHSDSISFYVVVILPKPRLSLQTGKDPAFGEPVQMSCSISTQYLGGTFTLQQLSGSYRETKAASGSSADFTIRQVDFVHEGSYYCQYQTRVSNRDFSSNHSNFVSFTITVSLPQPVISASGPDGELSWGTHGPEVPRGQSFSIVCSIQSQYPGGSFHLVSDGSDEIWTELAVNNSASFYFTEADLTHGGNYSCFYEVTLSSRLFKSTKTDELHLTIRELTWKEASQRIISAHPLAFYGTILALLLLFLVLFSVFLLWKYKTHHGYVVRQEYWPMTTYECPDSTENL